ncbi:MAG: CDP-diacylglycerol--glycerol-3-phosphate 3-phosphatidyltransferase [Verrucomicrobia bacterium]|nr:CDP-diacylglycerol--glycerol-3-phosphate 3-phosphatidyltransferase [Verrucomicrobiota bacterium]
MNLPNRLTLVRLVLVLPFVWALSVSWTWSKPIALLLFLIASVTDYADGYIARRFGLVTVFGQLMDPLVDKIMTVSAFICLVATGDISAWAVIVIVSREFLITGLRLVGVSRGRTLPAEKLGKYKTVWQIMTVIYYLLWKSLKGLGWLPLSPEADKAFSGIGFVILMITVLLTILSGLTYLAKNRDLVSDV